MSVKHILNRTMLSVCAASTTFKLQLLPQPWLKALKQNGDIHVHPEIAAPIKVKWMHPPTGRLKHNVDGAFKLTAGSAGGGGILRDHKGRCMLAFAMKYQGAVSALDAEARALRDSLKTCCNKGFLDIMVETDSLILMQIVTGELVTLKSHNSYDLTAAHQMGYKLIDGRVTKALKGQEPDVEEESVEDEGSDEDSHAEPMDAQGGDADVPVAPAPQVAALDIETFMADQLAQMTQLFTARFDQLNMRMDNLADSQANLEQKLDHLTKDFHDFCHPIVPRNDDA
ncbi:hypothetical protein Taro_031690 [Colocasia esculenta]|uniref:RNase H type-1 domain-containing protein n=1 Tax=Colocasia esculenta TaxID=4460 RepID=A0A843VSP0_COLES|nr:hypothetical protein [Colocasia esculenta]